MRLALSFVLPLLAVLALIAYATIPLFDRLMYAWSVRDLEARSRLVAASVEAPLGLLTASAPNSKLQNYFERLLQDERLYGVGLCDATGALKTKTHNFPEQIGCASAPKGTEVLKLKQGPLHVAKVHLEAPGL